VGLSVSRVGFAAAIKAMKQVGATLKLDLAQYRELAAFAQFGSDLDAKTKAQLDRGQRIVEVFKQKNYSPLPVEQQVAMLWTIQNGYFDEVPVPRVKEYQDKFNEFLITRKEAVLKGIWDKKQIDKDVEGLLRAAADEFKSTWK